MTEHRVIMLGVGVLVGLAPLAAVWPVIDIVMTTLLLGAAGTALAWLVLREVVREFRFRREMRALDDAPSQRAEVRT